VDDDAGMRYPFESLLSKSCPRSRGEDGRETVECLPRLIYRRHEEMQYLDLVARVINDGEPQDDRTGTGSMALFGCTMRFDLSQTFPLLTTKRVFWRGVAEELLWFIRGDTNGNHLLDVGVKIWEPNGTREYLDSRRLQHHRVNDLGPIYGFQWRHFGAKYEDMDADYRGKGIDQLSNCIQQLKENPHDRRVILSAWNPLDLKEMALPPCHLLCNFFVANGRLSCLMYQRSADIGLGVPFNIASYALLTRMIAQVCGFTPGEFIHVLGNTHIYRNHIEPLKTQLQRFPRPFPVLRVNPEVTDIDSFKIGDFELIGYNPWPKIDMDMSV